MSVGWFLAGLVLGAASRSGRCDHDEDVETLREEVRLERRLEEKEERRSRVRAAWERRHPWKTALRVVAILLVIGVFLYFGMSACAGPMLRMPL